MWFNREREVIFNIHLKEKAALEGSCIKGRSVIKELRTKLMKTSLNGAILKKDGG